MSPKTLLVVSDLHLGGRPGFQMCPPAGQEQLARFFTWVAERVTHVHLVIAGDVLDFLAEEEEGRFKALTLDEGRALAKLERILDDTRSVWDALAGVVKAGAEVTVLLGNHDVELSYPVVRRRLLDTLGAGRVELVYDNQALAVGPVLIEHGNRYDRWNVVWHDDLRQHRSRLSRRLPAGAVTVQPGSELVAQVMNPVKKDYPFVDLLKPETSCVLPLLAYLHPVKFKQGVQAVKQAYRASIQRFEGHGEPVDPNHIAANEDAAEADFRLGRDIAAGGAAGAIGALQLAEHAVRWAEEGARGVELRLLHRALGALAAGRTRAFDVGVEDEVYLTPARERFEAGFRVVIMGHTHLPKRVGEERVYLNTGTWADLLRIPDGAYGEDPSALAVFAQAMAQRDVGAFRKPLPTFARVILDGDQVVEADVHLFDGPDETPSITTQLVIARMEGR